MLFFFSLKAFNIISLFSACGFNGNVPWGGSILVKFFWCPGGFLYLNGQNFLEIWESFC
jgi:hypothetical protein